MLPDHFSAAERPVRQALAEHVDKARHWHLADLFADDAGRFDTLSREGCGLLVDYSKQRLTGKPWTCCGTWPGPATCRAGSAPCSKAAT